MSTTKNRNIYSFYNAFSAMGLTLVNGLLGIVVTYFVIAKFGSDFNGLNSTANQIVNVLLVLEGGFTLASNVALFAPLNTENYTLVNGILAATKKKFRQIGSLFLVLGLIVAVVYALVVNSGLSKEFIATVIVMTVVPQAFNLFYATTYRVLLQTQQKEYIISLMTMLTVGLGHITNILLITHGGQMWMVRFVTMVFALVNSFLIAGYVKKKCSFIDFKVEPRKDLIKGTNDVMVQKITGVIYNATPIVFLSILPTGGTMLASVYAVYNNIFVMIKSLLHGLIDAPRLGFGQMVTERTRSEIWDVFKQYEYAAFLAVFTLLTTVCTLILPFINLYTKGIADINYLDGTIALLMVLIAFIEMIHIPSGHMINMAGEFKISRNFQTIACVFLLITMFIGGNFWGIYGMLSALLLTAILLAFMELGYIHTRFFEKKLPELFKLMLPLAITGVILCFIESKVPMNISSYASLILFGIICIFINAVVAILISLIVNRRVFLALVARGRNIFLRRR